MSTTAEETAGNSPSESLHEMLRAMMARSNRELLRELASQSSVGVAIAGFDATRDGGPPCEDTTQSVEQISREVVNRILEESPELFKAASRKLEVKPEECSEAEKESADLLESSELIEDLKAVPWTIWVGGEHSKSNAFLGIGGPPASSEVGAAVATATVGSEELVLPAAKGAVFLPQQVFCAKTPFSPPGSGTGSTMAFSTSDPHTPRAGGADQDVDGKSEASSREAPSFEPSSSTMVAGLRMLSQTRQQTWMSWNKQPKNILLVAKPGDPEVIRVLREVAIWLDSQQATILFEPALLREIQGRPVLHKSDAQRACGYVKPVSGDAQPQRQHSKSIASHNTNQHRWGWDDAALRDGAAQLPPQFTERCRTWSPDHDRLEEACDLVICFGGDGTLCWAASLFSGALPPVIAFAGGSLGFLTPFVMKDWMSALVPLVGANLRGHVMRPVPLACRTRFQLRLCRSRGRGRSPRFRSAHENRGDFDSEDEDEQLPPMRVLALNEVLVHRGHSSLVKLDVFVSSTRITTVQGDGLILATPTGSTAYSLAAGGSMVHPSVPGIILTPVCPHSLSFRPVVLPDAAVVRVKVPWTSRNSTARVAVDGHELIQLERGDSIEVSVSPFPVPTICKKSETEDWFMSVNEALKWNLRQEQKGSPPPHPSKGQRRCRERGLV
eukprot:TRINITY_DN18349_c0_g1_i1.p1 TRINITY_DN18349_c0_g1~~TRINITY_DN18349_c0_g1_i1.p1  ORF type:complete len:670 (-),score=95.99 TRINITY_DN18349_c0_g1_i1:146-2155(-)